ncbi:ABC transporter permease [Paraburkholderia tropica]|uniref:Transport permease protein n=1 Tax=Paraburkholderia tropica TaxID=92647 RepID=A0AAQ1JXP3_9BURK|nr:ABC transporter permease [Paraburkholderia tropica]RQN37257.1 sugar ABC transporter permease [Paraburkholderia tropica]SEK13036.1 ABC-2 type transport system permease protein [Paraburkholderia tropica]
MLTVNIYAIRALYSTEMARTWRTAMQNVLAPVISTTLYFVVFGSAIGSKISTINGISYGNFIVPGLVMLCLQTQSVSNASYAIYFPKFTGAVFELLSAPISHWEVATAYVAASSTKSIIVSIIILLTAIPFVNLHILHPLWLLVFLLTISVNFSLLGLLIGILANSFEKLQLIPLLILTPLTFLGGSFYSVNMLPSAWKFATMFNPIVYLVSGLRWCFYGFGDTQLINSLAVIASLFSVLLAIVAWIFRSGYRLKR